MKTKQLRRMSAKVELLDNGITRLVSYNSVVMDYDRMQGVLFVYNHFDYSTTTSKHIRAFLADYVHIEAGIQDVRDACKTGRLYHLIVVRDTKHFVRG